MSETRRTLAASLLVAGVAAFLFALDPRFFLRDDFLLQFLPASGEVARAWSEGSFPLLAPFTWFGTALAAEYQYGVFSVARTVIEGVAWLLPLPLVGRAAFLFIVYEGITAAGSFRLARSYGVSPPLATMVAVVAALNGWNLWWGTAWFVAVTSFAWIPWLWLALRAVLDGTSRWGWAGVVVTTYLILTAGSPYVAVMAAAVAIANALVALFTARRRAALWMTLSTLLGVALSAPALMMLAEVYPWGARMTGTESLEPMWVVPAAALIGLVVPAVSVSWPVFLEWRPHHAVELAGAFVPLVGVVAATFTRGRELLRQYLGESLLLVVALAATMLPSPAPLRWSFHWLPLVHLTLALLGACALERVRRPWLWGLGLVLVALGVAPAFDHDLRATLTHGALLIVLCGAWAVLERRGLAGWMPAVLSVLAIVATFAAFSRSGEVPLFEHHGALLDPRPFDPSRRYLAMYDAESIIGRDDEGRRNRGLGLAMRPGNTPALAGLIFVNGYSPIRIEGMSALLGLELHGTMAPERAEELLRFESGRNQLLHHMGVDGLLIPEAMALRHRELLTRNGWELVARTGSCLVVHRMLREGDRPFAAAVADKVPNDEEAYRAIAGRSGAALPVVLTTPGSRGRERYGNRVLTDIEQRRLQTSFVVRGTGAKALVIVRRPWLPGFQATLRGRPIPVLRADLMMPAVEIPAGEEGEVVLFYRPQSLVSGLWVAGLALLVLGVLSIRIRGIWPST